MSRAVFRTLYIAPFLLALFAFALPQFAAAQPGEPHHPPPGAPHPPARPAVVPHGPPPGAPHGPPPGRPFVGGPHPGPGGPGGPHGPFIAEPRFGPGQFTFRGRMIGRMHIDPFIYPPGWGYQRWVVGGILPPLFLAPAYFYADWAGLGLPPPQEGYQWVRYGPDLLLVDVATGQVVDVAYGVFY